MVGVVFVSYSIGKEVKVDVLEDGFVYGQGDSNSVYLRYVEDDDGVYFLVGIFVDDVVEGGVMLLVYI